MSARIKSEHLLCILCLLMGTGCGQREISSISDMEIRTAAERLAATASSNHVAYLSGLIAQGNQAVGTNWTLLKRTGLLPKDSPLRNLIAASDEDLKQEFSTTSDEIYARILSDKSARTVGMIIANTKLGRIEQVYDSHSLAFHQAMESKIRNVVPTREKALALFGNDDPEKQTSPDQLRARKEILAALLLPADCNCVLRMSAPGGTNLGEGTLRVIAHEGDTVGMVASVHYPLRMGTLLSALFTQYDLGRLVLWDGWPDFNIYCLSLDSQRHPAPPLPVAHSSHTRRTAN